MTAPELLLAVDGGGTKTQALVAGLDGKVLARGLGPSSNLHNVGFAASCQAVATAIEGALMHVLGPQASGPEPWQRARFAAACFGLSGVDAPEDEAQVARWIRERTIAPRFLVVNDSELVLAGGTPEGWGIALISGTGSVCLGRTPEGRTARAGGWGPLLGDEGSGYQIAINGLRLAARTADGRADAPAILEAVMRHCSLRDASALIRYVHAPTMGAAELAGLATVVLDAAARGDAAAAAIVEDAARELAGHVEVVARKLRLTRPPLALGGGLLRGQLKRAVLDAVTIELGPTAYVPDPSLGAVALARRLVQPGAPPS
jgi:N-acetylglucosamine kinase-like BadF-type ATPase